MVLINSKDIIRINQEVGERGVLRNESSLDFALSVSKNKAWLYQIAYLLRALLIDHAFEEGNKRTALALVFWSFDFESVHYDKERVIRIIYFIAKKNIKSVNKIMRMLKDAIDPLN